LAIGIAPSKTVMRLEPGESAVKRLKIINTRGMPTDVEIIVEGDLEDYISLDETIVTINETEKIINLQISLPKNFDDPGMLTSSIVFKEAGAEPVRREKYSQNVGLTAIKSQIVVHVPFPNKYLSADLKLNSQIITREENLRMVIPLHNLGDELLDEVRANIMITDAQGQVVYEHNTKIITLEKGQDSKFTVVWVADDTGLYDIDITVSYDGKQRVLKSSVQVDQPICQAQDVPEVEVINRTRRANADSVDIRWGEIYEIPGDIPDKKDKLDSLILTLMIIFVVMIFGFEVMWFTSMRMPKRHRRHKRKRR